MKKAGLRRPIINILFCFQCIGSGWGTWIRTKILGVRVRCSTVELSPTEAIDRSEEHTSELQSRRYLGCRLLLEKKDNSRRRHTCRSVPVHKQHALRVRDAP